MKIIEQLTNDMLTQRIPDLTGWGLCFVRDETPRANQIGQGIRMHGTQYFSTEQKSQPNFSALDPANRRRFSDFVTLCQIHLLARKHFAKWRASHLL
jgi:hypothetical protein